VTLTYADVTVASCSIIAAAVTAAVLCVAYQTWLSAGIDRTVNKLN